MNERIRELELEAIAYADSKVPANNRYNDIYYSIVRRVLVNSVILDCIEIVKEDMYSGMGHHSQFSLGSDTALEMAVANIKEKFGVEE